MSGLVFKGASAKLGNVSSQAKIVNVENPTFKAISLTTDSAKLSSFLPIENIVDAFIKRGDVTGVGPLFTVMPFFRPKFPVPDPVDNRLSNRNTGPDVRFSAYEELTGVSKIRPEILFVTNFQPIFEKSIAASSERMSRAKDVVAGLNPVGEFLDAQIQLQHLKHEAMVKLIKDLKQDPDVAFELDDRENDFKFHIDNLSKHVQTLYDVIDDVERLKLKLNIKSSPPIAFETLANRFFANLLKTRSFVIRANVAYDTPEFETSSLSSITLVKALSFLGFDSRNCIKFSNTKIVMQSFYELYNLLKCNSCNVLGASKNEQASDDNNVYVNQHLPPGFSFNPGGVGTVVFDQIRNIEKKNVLTIVNSVKSSFDTLFSAANFTSAESRIAFLFNFLSREYVLSRGLGNKSTAKFVSDTFGYTPNDTNSNAEMLDAIFGSFGNKITDRVDAYSANSFMTIAQKVSSNVAILPFEPDFIDFEENVFTPGSSYFIDEALNISEDGKFNLTNLDTFSKELGAFTNRFSEIASAFGMLPTVKRVPGSTRIDATVLEKMVHGRTMLELVAEYFMNMSNFQGYPEMVASDALAIFTTADKDNYLKSLLFCYLFLKIYAFDTPTAPASIEAIIEEIDKRIDTTQTSRAITSITISSVLNRVVLSESKFGVSNISQNSISTELKEFRSTSAFLNTFFAAFRNIWDAFQTSNAMVNGHTRFNAIQDVVLMMTIFEALLSMITTYIPKNLQGKFATKSSSTIGQQFYRAQILETQETSIAKNILSFNTVRGKINFEVDSIAKLVFAILGSVTQVKDSIDSIIRSMKMETKIKSINDILAILGNRKLLQMILNPQQIFLIKSIVDDINKKISTDFSFTKAAGSVDFELRGPGRDDIALLDDSLVTQNVKQSLLSFFANEKFSSQKGNNIRLLTVGIPMGFTQKLKEKVKLDKVSDTSYNPKQVDVVKINVYKVDVEHQDVIFKPQSFLFELSRFVNRTGLDDATVTPGMPLDKILESIGTRDYSLANDEKTDLKSSQYNFLSEDQKKKIPQNHVISYFIELYVKLLTGISVSEYDLYVDPSQVPFSTASPLIIERAAENVVSNAFGPQYKIGTPLLSIFGATVQTNAPVTLTKGVMKTTKAVAALKAGQIYSPAAINKLNAGAGVIESVKRARTVFSDNLEESKRVFLPRTFDRVFNVAVDPDDFEINVEETLKSPSGKDAFDKLLKQGVIVGEDSQAAFFASSGISGVFKIRERSLNESDLTFEKYFVTIDTVMDEVV